MRIKTAYYIYSDIFHFCCFSFIPEVLHFPVVSFSFSWRTFFGVSFFIFLAFLLEQVFWPSVLSIYFIFNLFFFLFFFWLFSPSSKILFHILCFLVLRFLSAIFFCISLKKASIFPFISIVFNIPTMNLVVIAVLALIW